MDKIIRDVRDIDVADRQALEHVIGQRLRENQQVIINVVNVDISAAPSEQANPNGAQPDDEVPEWWKVYEGLSDEEVDRLDTAIRERANLTRIFE
jgi:hypothetical protein